MMYRLDDSARGTTGGGGGIKDVVALPLTTTGMLGVVALSTSGTAPPSLGSPSSAALAVVSDTSDGKPKRSRTTDHSRDTLPLP